MAAGIVALSAGQRALAAISFNFDYTDVNVGFNDPTYGNDRKAALADAAGRISAYFINYNATIDLQVDGSVTDDNTLASAGSNQNGAWPGLGFNDRGDVMLKILGGNAADPAPGIADGMIHWNFEDHVWALGNSVGAGQIDFISTAMHELTHALGFVGGITEGDENDWGDPAGTPTAWTPMDQWLTDATGTHVIAGDYSLDLAIWDAAKAGGSSLFFSGPNAVAAYGGLVPMYSPVVWEDGSSGGSHLDDATFLAPNFMLMNAIAQPDGTLDARAYHDIELGILRDIGYTQIVAIPEPASLGLLMVGCLAFARRRRVAS